MTYEIYITNRCTLRCPGCIQMCDRIQDPNSDMTLEEVDDIISQINEVDCNINTIRIIGGEPTIHSRCFDICKMVHDGISAKRFELATNHHDNDLCYKVEKELGYNILIQDGSTDEKVVAKNKINKHISPYLSPSDCAIPLCDPYQCQGLKDSCGIAVNKYRGQFIWTWCAWSATLARLMNEPKYLKGSLRELLRCGFRIYADNICPHCARLGKYSLLAKDSYGVVSERFKKGLEEEENAYSNRTERYRSQGPQARKQGKYDSLPGHPSGW